MALADLEFRFEEPCTDSLEPIGTRNTNRTAGTQILQIDKTTIDTPSPIQVIARRRTRRPGVALLDNVPPQCGTGVFTYNRVPPWLSPTIPRCIFAGHCNRRTWGRGPRTDVILLVSQGEGGLGSSQWSTWDACWYYGDGNDVSMEVPMWFCGHVLWMW